MMYYRSIIVFYATEMIEGERKKREKDKKHLTVKRFSRHVMQLANIGIKFRTDNFSA